MDRLVWRFQYLGWDNPKARTANCSAYMWTLQVAWLPDSNFKAVRLLMQWLKVPSTSVPANKTKTQLSLMTQPQRSLSASYPIGQNSHKPTQIQGEENYTPTLEGEVARSHWVQKSMHSRRHCHGRLQTTCHSLPPHCLFCFSLKSC